MKLKDFEHAKRLKDWLETYQARLSMKEWDGISFSLWDMCPSLERHLRESIRETIKELRDELKKLGVEE